MLPGTAQAWIEALTVGRSWNCERDTPRVRQAFITLAQTVRRWPAPVEFSEALPKVRIDLGIAYERKPANPEFVREIGDKVRAMFAGDVNADSVTEAVERKRAAAGDA